MTEGNKTIEGLAAQLGVPSSVAREHLGAELRALRAALPLHGQEGLSPPTPGGWNKVMYAYDEALVVVGHMLDIPDAPDPEYFIGYRRLTELERKLLEEGVTAAGIDLRPRMELGG